MNELWIVRHGATEWSETGRHTSRSDVPLLPAGVEAAAALAPVLARHEFGAVLTSPMGRARATAGLAGFGDAIVDDDLREWDYGELEGITTDDIRARGGEFAAWTIWQGPVPGGESIDQVAARARRVLARVASASGDVLCFGHGHSSRVLVALALALDPRAGARFVLEPATLNVVGSEHDERALLTWNVRV